MQFRLRTLMVAAGIVPPVAALVWWLMFRTQLLPPMPPAFWIVMPIAAVTGIMIFWIDDLLAYLSRRG